MLFGKRAVQIKFVKPSTDSETGEVTTENIETFKAYAEVVKDVAGDVASMVLVVTVVKAACDIGRIIATAVAK
jgi:hypothetical protein